jgi:hypothetical protein
VEETRGNKRREEEIRGDRRREEKSLLAFARQAKAVSF